MINAQKEKVKQLHQKILDKEFGIKIMKLMLQRDYIEN